MKPLLIGIATLAFACTPSSAARISAAQTALNVLSDTIDPAYESTRFGCAAVEQGALALEQVGQISLNELDMRIRESRVRCDAIVSVYEQILELQISARALLKQGDAEAISQAEKILSDIRNLWRKLL